jgi:hypothetical protein
MEELRPPLKLSYSSSWDQWWRESAVSLSEQQYVAVDILLSAAPEGSDVGPAAERKQLS